MPNIRNLQESIGSMSSSNNSEHRKVSIQARSIPIGNFVVVNGYRVNLEILKNRFVEGGYAIYETPRFLLFTRAEAPSTIVVHWFAPHELNADVMHYLNQELKPFEIFTCTQHFGEVLSGIVGSLFPDDTRRAWRYFGANTLQRYLVFLSSALTPPLPDYATIGMFATIYQRILELRVGTSFLDVGCASGFLPLLIAERIPFVDRIVGIDINKDAFATAKELAEERSYQNVQYFESNLLADDFACPGQFDTVVALHVLEHLTEHDMYRALANILRVTSQRLILAVPYEEGQPEASYGHVQIFLAAMNKHKRMALAHHFII
jgi:2-polyprenyl-3-methyl-5-hydroxy-6-metoxy-1,4-benzoquinol methylase